MYSWRQLETQPIHIGTGFIAQLVQPETARDITNHIGTGFIAQLVQLVTAKGTANTFRDRIYSAARTVGNS